APFIIDLRREQLGVREARRVGIAVVALVDTNCDPDESDYVVPGNDEAIRACSLITRVIADGIEAGKARVTPEELTAAPARPRPEAPPEEAAPTAEEVAPTAAEVAEEPAYEVLSQHEETVEAPQEVEAK